MPQPDRIKVWVLWNVIGPIATNMLGYQLVSKLGIGKDLPLGVYRHWKRWCSFPRYFFDDAAPDVLSESICHPSNWV
jgi:predicted alpha/beta hydrolase